MYLYQSSTYQGGTTNFVESRNDPKLDVELIKTLQEMRLLMESFREHIEDAKIKEFTKYDGASFFRKLLFLLRGK